MKLGILQCDDVAPQLMDEFENYPEMFKTAFSDVDPTLDYQTYAVHRGELPATTDACDAYLITGSKMGVYEPHDWIPRLENFIRQLYQENRRLVGICFGHQVMSQALGGLVAKSDKGWGVGLSFNQVTVHKPWMQPASDRIDLVVSHQDQVLELPEQTEVLASSQFCPNYLLQYGGCFLSVQGHPEFSKEYSTAIMNMRRGKEMPENRVREGLISLKGDNQGRLMVQWLINFLKSS